MGSWLWRQLFAPWGMELGVPEISAMCGGRRTREESVPRDKLEKVRPLKRGGLPDIPLETTKELKEKLRG